MYGNSSLSCFFQTYLKEHGTSPEYLLGSKRKTFVNTFHYPSHLRLPLGLPVRKRRTSILSKEKKKFTHLPKKNTNEPQNFSGRRNKTYLISNYKSFLKGISLGYHIGLEKCAEGGWTLLRCRGRSEVTSFYFEDDYN